MSNNKGFSVVLLLLFPLLVIVVVVGFILIQKQSEKFEIDNSSTTVKTPETETVQDNGDRQTNKIIRSYWSKDCEVMIETESENIRFDVHYSFEPNCWQKRYNVMTIDGSLAVFESKTSSSGNDGIRLYIADSGLSPYINFIFGELKGLYLSPDDYLVTHILKTDGSHSFEFYDLNIIKEMGESAIDSSNSVVFSEELYSELVLSGTNLDFKTDYKESGNIVTIFDGDGNDVKKIDLTQVFSQE